MIYVAIALCAVVIIYLFLIMPGWRKKTDIFKKQPLYAHRGLFGGDKPENSMAAFAAAVEAGYGIELDVHKTTDGVAVVHHDDSLKRMCGVDKMIEQCTYDEIKDAKLPDGSPLPLFKDVLKLIDGKVPLIIELKCTKTDVLVADVADEILKDYKGEYCVESFDPFVVKRYKKLRREIMCGQLAGKTYAKDDTKKMRFLKFCAQRLLFNVISRPDFVAYDIKCKNSVGLALCRLFGAMIAFWTIRDKEKCEYSLRKKAAAIFQEFKP